MCPSPRTNLIPTYSGQHVSVNLDHNLCIATRCRMLGPGLFGLFSRTGVQKVCHNSFHGLARQSQKSAMTISFMPIGRIVADTALYS